MSPRRDFSTWLDCGAFKRMSYFLRAMADRPKWARSGYSKTPDELACAVMPTRGRVAFAKHALESFHSQTYPNKQLIILDDADDRSFPEGVNHPLVTYAIQ